MDYFIAAGVWVVAVLCWLAGYRAAAKENERLQERIAELYRAQKNMFLSLKQQGLNSSATSQES